MLPAFKAVNRKLQNTNIKMFFLSVFVFAQFLLAEPILKSDRSV